MVGDLGDVGGTAEWLKNSEHEILKDRPDDIFFMGARSFSIWRASDMSLVYDSGSDFERITAQTFPQVFNAHHRADAMDARSARKGPEPEDVKVMTIGEKIYAFIGLERIGGLMMYDITNPSSPVFVDYFNNRSETPAASPLTDGDRGAEGIFTIPAADSPTGWPMVLVANEVSGTITVLQINDGFEKTINILHTNDVHGRVYQVDGNNSGMMGMDRVAGIKNATTNAILVDAGDAIHGLPIVNMNQGKNAIDLMAKAGYSVMTAGNHEFRTRLNRKRAG